MVVLGVDPGTRVTGFGIVEVHRNKVHFIHAERLSLPASETIYSKLDKIYAKSQELIGNFKVHELSVEDIFYAQNIKAVLMLGQARAAAILAAFHLGIPINEYQPRIVKQSIVGRGNARKEQVEFMVKKILGIEMDLSLDETDALAVAVSHIHRISLRGRIK